jgi:DNA-binding PadR family transcriptional regulator
LNAAPEALERDLGPGDWAIVALLAEQPVHGWGLIQKLKPDGEIGAVWSLARPAVYRSLEMLQQRGLIEQAGLERSQRGPYRMVFRPTRKGRAALKEWLAAPVEHVRDVRWLFLLKLVLAARAGVDRRPMIRAQRAVLEPSVAALGKKLGHGSEAEQIYVRFRLDTTRAVLAFLDELLEEAPGRTSRRSR